MSSNCNKFRCLIEQQFDVDLTPQDDRMLMSHLDQCEILREVSSISCNK